MFAAFFRTLSRLIPLPHWDQANAGNVGRMSIYEMRIIQSLHHSSLEEVLFKSLKVQTKKLLDNGFSFFLDSDFSYYWILTSVSPISWFSLLGLLLKIIHNILVCKYFFLPFLYGFAFLKMVFQEIKKGMETKALLSSPKAKE